MPVNAIVVENLCKRYLIGHRFSSSGGQYKYTALRDVLEREINNFARKAVDVVRGRQVVQGDEVEQFWALKGVNFEVKQGEVLGIIGRNGVGKSTLLKILSRITDPTEGRVLLRGRVASLLEVGTGFHPELTGRENIFLNGAVLGMTQREIRKKFDEIVSFAEIEKFLDTPVKHYSSGMYVRLAFAVAAHLEPEILLVDEVLAVGDAQFQKKCLGKMDDVAKGGRTVLFVSHNMPAVNRLCRRCILLESGMLKSDGDAHHVSAQYMVSDTGLTGARRWVGELRPGDDTARLMSVRVLQHDRLSDIVDIRSPVTLEMTYETVRENATLLSAFSLFDAQGIHLFTTGDLNNPRWSQPRPRGIYTSRCRIPGNLFSEGMIRVVAEVATRHPVYQIHFLEHDSVAFQVVDSGGPGSVRGDWGRPILGVMRPLCGWETEIEHESSKSLSVYSLSEAPS
jgi:lipopolysaccharide transport system ATP-binding protein